MAAGLGAPSQDRSSTAWMHVRDLDGPDRLFCCGGAVLACRVAGMSTRPVVRRLSAKLWLLTAIVAAQLVVPAIALFDTPPTRFGFQMYSAQGGVAVEVVDRAGQDVPFDLSEILAGPPRPEFDWTGVLPERICESEPQAVRVTVTQPERERTVRC